MLLRHFEYLSNGDAAEVLGLSEPAAGMRYLRAMRRLARSCKNRLRRRIRKASTTLQSSNDQRPMANAQLMPKQLDQG